MIAMATKYLTTTSDNYSDLTNQMIKSSGQADWEVIHEKEEGDFGSSNFNRLCNSRMRQVLGLLKIGHDVFVCDGDVIWLKPIEEPDGNDWITAQEDPDTGLCAGVCFYRSCPATIAIVELVVSESENKDAMFNDQIMLNTCLRELQRQSGQDLRLGVFENVLSWGLLRDDDSLWDGQEFDLPASCHAFHANYTIGINNKRRMLKKFING